MDWHHHITRLMRTVVKQVHDEQMEHREKVHDLYHDRLEGVFKALAELEDATVDGVGNYANWPALDEDQILRMLEMLPVVREKLDLIEIELLDAAQHAGVSWEAINPVYAPIPAAAAKARYVELAMRIYGSSVVGPTKDTNA
ncbi:hypothetical protein IU459_32950 [Nocardia amamiensis]|uniref:Uncharacterized protein n=1 Tax=Nocardia amamiensis TaxID=404578 RepID=A0ABS0D1M5_9NOCA|nr:hypothetical protein [Nocardia amamiensis]MBF6302315.1 hypothetical protein [Nocardia amamiensis]